MKLVINADDAGVDVSRNKGIFQAIDHGVVRSISVIVRQKGWEDVLARLKERGPLSVGLHFNLTAGKPVAEKHKTLNGADGFFFNKVELLGRVSQGLIDSKEVTREFTAQFDVLKKSKIIPTHIDGHNHVHIFPGVREGILEVAPEKTWIRLPWEHQKTILDPKGKEAFPILNDPECFIGALNYYSSESKDLWGNKFRYVDDFTGTRATSETTLTIFKESVNQLQGGICELMCHPGGEPDEQSTVFSKLHERRIEKEILTSGELTLFLKEKEIENVSFNDL